MGISCNEIFGEASNQKVKNASHFMPCNALGPHG